MLRIGLFLITNLAILVVAGLILNVLGVGHYLDRTGSLDLGSLLAICAVFGFVGSLVSLFLSKFMAKRAMGVQLITQPRSAEELWLVNTVTELAREAGIETPEIGIFPAQESNAFATGWNRNQALVAVSQGLLQRFSRDEVKAVLGHEIGHVANGDMVTLALIQGVVNTFVMFFARIIGHTIDRALAGNREGQHSTGIAFYVTTIIAELVLGVLASMVVAAFSRYREYRADAAGAQLAGRGAMIRALQRLQAETNAGVESAMPASMKAFAISGGVRDLFATHPPLAARIEALNNHPM